MNREYIILTFPEVQQYMEESWFKDECQLVQNPNLTAEFGYSAYFVPSHRVIKPSF